MSVPNPCPTTPPRCMFRGRRAMWMTFPTPKGSLHLAFGLSPIAKGKIKAMDLSDVRAAHGVVMVVTAEDLPFANDVSPSIHDEPLLSDGTVNYIGQPVFLVVATSHLAARKAARLGKIDYAEETPILTVDEALAADSRFEEGPRIYAKGRCRMPPSQAPRM